MKRRKGFYSISVVSKMFSVHQQTVRMYEKEGLICPKRTQGNTRLFSEEDVDRLEQVINLTHKMGINIAGVQMILKLQNKMKKMQSDMNTLFEQVQGQLDKESGEYKKQIEQHGKKLLDMKKDCGEPSDQASVTIDIDQAAESFEGDDDSADDWEIEYDDD
jgi:MerR family transcriptional regulator, heat shock protein HspR